MFVLKKKITNTQVLNSEKSNWKKEHNLFEQQLYKSNYLNQFNKNNDFVYKLILNKEYSVPIYYLLEIPNNDCDIILKNYWLILDNINKRKRYRLFNTLLYFEYMFMSVKYIPMTLNLKLYFFNKIKFHNKSKIQFVYKYMSILLTKKRYVLKRKVQLKKSASDSKRKRSKISFSMVHAFAQFNSRSRTNIFKIRKKIQKHEKRKKAQYSILIRFYKKIQRYKVALFLKELSGSTWLIFSALQYKITESFKAFEIKNLNDLSIFKFKLAIFIYKIEYFNRKQIPSKVFNEITLKCMNLAFIFNSLIQTIKQWSSFVHLNTKQAKHESSFFSWYLASQYPNRNTYIYSNSYNLVDTLYKSTIHNDYTVYKHLLLKKWVILNKSMILYSISKDLISFFTIQSNMVKLFERLKYKRFVNLYNRPSFRTRNFTYFGGKTRKALYTNWITYYDAEQYSHLERQYRDIKGYIEYVVKRLTFIMKKNKKLIRQKKRQKRKEQIMENSIKNSDTDINKQSNSTINNDIVREKKRKRNKHSKIKKNRLNNSTSHIHTKPKNKRTNTKTIAKKIGVSHMVSELNNPIISVVANDYRWVLYFTTQDYHIRTFINFLTKNGNKNKAYKIFFKTLQILKEISVTPPLLVIKKFFSSDHQYFLNKTIMMKKKTRFKVVLYKWKKRTNTLYHMFFKNLKELYITDFLSVSEKIVYLLMNYTSEYPNHDSIEESTSPESATDFYEKRHFLKKRKVNKKKKTVYQYNYKIRSPEVLLNYKKNY